MNKHRNSRAPILNIAGKVEMNVMKMTLMDFAYLINLKTLMIRNALKTLAEVPKALNNYKLSRIPDRIERSSINKSN